MQYRRLGKTGIEVSAIGFGTWAIGADWGPGDDEESLRALHAAADVGVTFFDDIGETFAGVDHDTALEVVEELRPLVPGGTTMAQMALSWILMNDGVSTVIPGAKNSEQARANAAAADLPPLPAATMARIGALYRDQVARLVHQRW